MLKLKIKNLLLSLIFLSLFSFSFSQENKKPYLYGVPPDPPFQEAEATLTQFVTDGCSLFDKKLVGYIINNGHDYTLVQDENGVRHKCYIGTNLTSNYDKSMLKYILIPGRKVEIKFETCGSGGFIFVMHIKNLKRK